MGLHTLCPTPDDTGLGSKVHKLVGGLGAIKNAYDIGHTLYDAATFAAPYAARCPGQCGSAGSILRAPLGLAVAWLLACSANTNRALKK